MGEGDEEVSKMTMLEEGGGDPLVVPVITRLSKGVLLNVLAISKTKIA